MRRAAKTGDWLTVLPSTVNGTDLGDQEWRDALFLWYGLEPPDLTSHCDGCDAKFTMSHALDYKKGGLVTARHNEPVAGYQTWPTRPSHLLMCVTTP